MKKNIFCIFIFILLASSCHKSTKNIVEISILEDVDLISKLSEGYASYGIISSKSGNAIEDGSLLGIIDENGKPITECKFSFISTFSESVARYSLPGEIDMIGYIDILGKEIIVPQYEKAQDFNYGLAAVKERGKKYGYINKQGEYIISPQFDDARAFHNGLAAVRSDDLWGYIDPIGEVVIPFMFTESEDFLSSVTFASYKDSGVLIDANGKILMNDIDLILNSSDNRLLIKYNNQLLLVNELAEIEQSFNFSADVNKETLFTINSKPSNILVQHVKSISNGMILFESDGKYGYLNYRTNDIIAPTFTSAKPFQNDYAIVEMNSKYGIINIHGEFVLEPTYELIHPISDTGVTHAYSLNRDIFSIKITSYSAE